MMDTLGARLKKYRLLHGLTQEALADALNVNASYYGRVERGERQFGLPKLLEICDYFNISFDDFLGRKPSHEKREAEKNTHIHEITAALNKCTLDQILITRRFIEHMLDLY